MGGIGGTRHVAPRFNDLYRFMALSLTEDAKESHTAWRDRRRPEIRGA
jgi:hypothetical protein